MLHSNPHDEPPIPLRLRHHGLPRGRGSPRDRSIPMKRSGKHAPRPSAPVPSAVSHANASLAGSTSAYVPVGLQRTSSGVSVVSLRQEYAGIPVLDGVRTVRLDDAGKVLAFTGKTLTVPAETPTSPAFPATAAAQEAFVALLGQNAIPAHLGFTPGPPDVVAAVPHPSCPTVLRRSPFVEPILASLVVDASRAKGRLL